MELLAHIWTRYLLNLLDILVVTYIFYRILLLIKGTRAVQITFGIVTLILLTFFVREILHLRMLSWLLGNFWAAAAVILVVVFQPEIRSGLTQLGSHRWSKILFSSELSFIDEVVSALAAFRQSHTGAIIILEQEIGLRQYIESGVIINAQVSKELIISIFNPKSPLHDGAVVIENTRLISAGCILPLSNDPDISKVLGTRHRAAIGLSEISDAVIIVVSEETGIMSLAREGMLETDVEPEDLKKRLVDLYRSRSDNARLRKNSNGAKAL
jgi:diadenylate cyclase